MKVDLDITHIYKSDDEWGLDYEVLSSNIETLNVKSDTYFESADSFYDFIKLRLDSENLTDKLYSYCKRQVDVDFSLDDYKEKMEQVLKLYSDLQIIGNKLEKDVIINSSKVEEYLLSDKLKCYQRFLTEILRKKEHVVDAEEAKSKLSNYMSKIQSIKNEYQDLLINKRTSETVNTSNGEVQVNKDSINSLMKDESRKNRKMYSDAYSRTYSIHEDKVTSLFFRKLSADIELSKFKNFDSLLDEKMFSYDLPSSLFRNLISSINSNLDILHDYNRLRKNILGLDEFHTYDTSLPICSVSKMKIELEDGVRYIKESLSVLGSSYTSLIDRMFSEGWIDVYPKDKKVNRSYTSIAYFGVPYIITNYNKSLNSLRNLIHEIGHAANVHFSKQVNMSHDFSVSFFLTEVSSKVNEMLFDQYMLKTCEDEEERKFILYNFINSLVNSIFNQVKLSEFEDEVVRKISNGEDISSQVLDSLYLELNKKYNGEDLITDENVKYGWILNTHFILQESYYVYQYSIGACLSLYIVNKLFNGDEDFVQKYIKFLSLGDSVSIKESLEVIGIDIDKNDFIQYGLDYLREKINEFKNLF